MAKLQVPSLYSVDFADLVASLRLAKIINDEDQPQAELTPKQKLEFMGAMNQVMDDESKDKILKDEMINLNDASATLKNTLNDISLKFQEVYDSAIHESFKSEVAKLKAEWDNYRSSFQDIDADAKLIAASASAIARDYADVFCAVSLCDRDKPVEKKKKEVNDYKKFIQDDESESKKIKDRLHQLIADVADFNGRWKTIAESEKKKLADDAKKLEATISNLNRQIDDLTSDINKAIAALVLSGVGIVASFVAGFTFPMFWLGTVVAAALAAVDIFIMVRLLIRKSELTSERDTAASKLKSIKGQQALIDALLTGVNSFSSEAAKVITALGAIEITWQSLIADMDDSIKQLESAAMTMSEDATELAYARIDTSRKLYKKTAVAFHHFASTG